MGLGDDVMATGFAKHLIGKRAAFGDGKRIIWGPWSEEVFRHNPKIARPGQERAGDLHWIDYWKGRRLYNSLNPARTHWVWNYDFRAVPGEIFFDAVENLWADTVGQDFIIIEPNVPWHKSVAVNKDWGLLRYQAVADHLRKLGHDVVQLSYGRNRLKGVRAIATPTYRHALAALGRARFALLPEGGLHHGAAAVGLPAVVIFGGFIPPPVIGYDMHINLTGDAEVFCGSLHRCLHCRGALDRISIDQVCERIHDGLARMQTVYGAAVPERS